MKVIKAPEPLQFENKSVFLAGSIEMGAAENWQEKVTAALTELDITVLNPRRDDWDSSWEQKKENPEFSKQVKWELNALDRADVIVLYFDPNTKSPISLLELGLYARSGKVVLYCPEGFYRKGNVDIVAERCDITQVSSMDELIGTTKAILDIMSNIKKFGMGHG